MKDFSIKENIEKSIYQFTITFNHTDAELEKKRKEEKKKVIGGAVWERDQSGWKNVNSIPMNEMDPVRGYAVQQSGISDDIIDKQVGRERWVKKVNGWQRTFIPLTNTSSTSSKEANTYVSHLTHNIMPSEV